MPQTAAEGRFQELLAPIRERRAELAGRPDDVLDVIRDGTGQAREVTQGAVDEIRAASGLFSLSPG